MLGNDIQWMKDIMEAFTKAEGYKARTFQG